MAACTRAGQEDDAFQRNSTQLYCSDLAQLAINRIKLKLQQHSKDVVILHQISDHIKTSLELPNPVMFRQR